MAWFKKTRKPLTAPAKHKASRVPEGLWVKCPDCAQIIYNKDLTTNLNVCPNCDFHRRIRAVEYCNIILDDGTMEEVEVDLRSGDPLGFPDYPQRLRKAISRRIHHSIEDGFACSAATLTAS